MLVTCVWRTWNRAPPNERIPIQGTSLSSVSVLMTNGPAVAGKKTLPVRESEAVLVGRCSRTSCGWKMQDVFTFDSLDAIWLLARLTLTSGVILLNAISLYDDNEPFDSFRLVESPWTFSIYTYSIQVGNVTTQCQLLAGSCLNCLQSQSFFPEGRERKIVFHTISLDTIQFTHSHMNVAKRYECMSFG